MTRARKTITKAKPKRVRDKPLPKSEKARVLLTLKKVMDLETSEVIRAFVAATKWDRAELKERGYHTGDELWAALYKSRNTKFHRLAHAIGNMMREHVPGFEHLTAHAALKRLQIEADAFCETEVIDATPAVSMMLGLVTAVAGQSVADEIAAALPARVVIERKVARSMSYDSMDQGEFEQCFAGMFDYMAAHYFVDMTADEVAILLEAYERDHN